MNLRFSIVVIAYKRKAYLMDAVKTALEQDYPKELIQVIVVKAFYDKDIDNFLKTSQVETIFSDTTDQGKSLCVALSKCNGDIITLLDDDDLFAPNKLTILSREYLSNPDLAVTVNSYDVVDKNCQPFLTDFGRSERKLQRELGHSLWRYPEYDFDLIIIKLNMLFNSSRISFSRDLIIDIMDISRKISFLVDILFVTFAIYKRRCIASLPEILTHYRLHDENISLVRQRENLIPKLLPIHRKIIKDIENISSYFRFVDVGFSKFFDLWHDLERLKLAMLGESKSEVIAATYNLLNNLYRQHSSFSVYRSRSFNYKSIASSLAFFPVFIVSMSLGRKIRLLFPF